jgi:hypothetical protein
MKADYDRETDVLTVVFADAPVSESDEIRPGAEVEALASAFAEILDSSLATEAELKDTGKNLTERLAAIEGNALMIGGALTLILKAFFQ